VLKYTNTKKILKELLKKLIYKINPNSKEVYITPKGARWRNLIYFFLRAYQYDQQGKNLRIIHTSHMIELLRHFPSLKKYIIGVNEIKFYHKKDNSNKFYQEFGIDFTEDDILNFIKEHLLTQQVISQYQLSEPANEDLTINIRRGDFYEKNNASIYGYDQIGFIKHVFKNHYPAKKWNRITVISDNLKWCKENFKFLSEFCQELYFPEFKDNQVILGFLGIANSKNLILSNSTFSFWGAYLSNYLYDSYENTICPIFGSRRIENTDLYQYNPRWNMITDFDFN